MTAAPDPTDVNGLHPEPALPDPADFDLDEDCCLGGCCEKGAAYRAALDAVEQARIERAAAVVEMQRRLRTARGELFVEDAESEPCEKCVRDYLRLPNAEGQPKT